MGIHRQLHLDNLKRPVELRDQISCSGKCHSSSSDETPVQSAIFRNALAEGTTLEVDGEGGDLLR
jgi:hypothetical protein